MKTNITQILIQKKNEITNKIQLLNNEIKRLKQQSEYLWDYLLRKKLVDFNKTYQDYVGKYYEFEESRIKIIRVCTEFECSKLRCIIGVFCVKYNKEGNDWYKYFEIYYENKFLDLIENGIELSKEEFYSFNDKYKKYDYYL